MPGPTSQTRLLQSSTRSRSGLTRNWTRGATNRAPVIIIPAIMAGLVLGGCRQVSPPPPTFTRGSVNVNALLTIHPAWNEVVELDKLIAHVASLSGSSPPASISLPDAVFPAPLTAAIAAPTTKPPPPAGSRSAAADRIARLRESLNEHSDRVVERERLTLEKRLEAEVAVERSRLRALPPKPHVVRNPEDEKKLQKLELEALALETQVKALFDPAQSEAQVQLNSVLAKIEKLKVPPARQQEVQETEIENQVEKFRAAKRADMQKTLAATTTQVLATSQQAVSAYRTGVRARLAEAKSPKPVTLQKTPQMPNPSLSSPKDAAAAAFAQGAPVSSGEAERMTELRAQRARLVKVITDDINRRVEGMAAEHHWTLVPSGGTDLTPNAADLLRKQIDSVKNGSVFR